MSQAIGPTGKLLLTVSLHQLCLLNTNRFSYFVFFERQRRWTARELVSFTYIHARTETDRRTVQMCVCVKCWRRRQCIVATFHFAHIFGCSADSIGIVRIHCRTVRLYVHTMFPCLPACVCVLPLALLCVVDNQINKTKYECGKWKQQHQQQ